MVSLVTVIHYYEGWLIYVWVYLLELSLFLLITVEHLSNLDPRTPFMVLQHLSYLDPGIPFTEHNLSYLDPRITVQRLSYLVSSNTLYGTAPVISGFLEYPLRYSTCHIWIPRIPSTVQHLSYMDPRTPFTVQHLSYLNSSNTLYNTAPVISGSSNTLYGTAPAISGFLDYPLRYNTRHIWIPRILFTVQHLSCLDPRISFTVQHTSYLDSSNTLYGPSPVISGSSNTLYGKAPVISGFLEYSFRYSNCHIWIPRIPFTVQHLSYLDPWTPFTVLQHLSYLDPLIPFTIQSLSYLDPRTPFTVLQHLSYLDPRIPSTVQHLSYLDPRTPFMVKHLSYLDSSNTLHGTAPVISRFLNTLCSAARFWPSAK